MRFAKLLHNPSAGHGGLGKKELVKLIQSAGFGCSYSSTNILGWEKIESKEIDFLILAGGDGTIRRVAGELLKRKLIDKRLPIAVLPFGTANNIAKTLGILGEDPEHIVTSWNERNIKKYDVGRIYGIKQSKFFLESFGFGVFPKLMEEMKKQAEKRVETPEKSLSTAWEILHEIIPDADPHYCRIKIDGTEHRGNYLLVEIMNTTSIGPKLHLAPLADPGDGDFDVVLISEKQKPQFLDYVKRKIEGIDEPPFFEVVKARKLEIFWDGVKAHVDDQIVKLKKPKAIEIDLLHGTLQFFVTEERNGSAELKGKA